MIRTESPEQNHNDDLDQTAHDVTETVLQLRMDNEDKQRQLIILQQRLVKSVDFQSNKDKYAFAFRTNNVN